MQRFCPHCGTPAESGDKFCRRCGAGLEKIARPEEVDSIKPPTRNKPDFLNGWIATTVLGIILLLADIIYCNIVLNTAISKLGLWEVWEATPWYDLPMLNTPLMWIAYVLCIIGCYGVLKCRKRSLGWLFLPIVFSLAGAGALLIFVRKENN